MNREQFNELRVKQFAQLSPVREMLNSPQGISFLRELRELAYNPPGGVYVPNAFDKTAFNLGIIFMYEQIAGMAKGMNDGRDRTIPL